MKASKRIVGLRGGCSIFAYIHKGERQKYQPKSCLSIYEDKVWSSKREKTVAVERKL